MQKNTVFKNTWVATNQCVHQIAFPWLKIGAFVYMYPNGVVDGRETLKTAAAATSVNSEIEIRDVL